MSYLKTVTSWHHTDGGDKNDCNIKAAHFCLHHFTTQILQRNISTCWMTNRRPPLALRIQSFLALEFCQCISRAWLFILDGFSCNYLRPHHLGSLLGRDCSSTGGNRPNMWKVFSWGCPPLSALTTTVGGDLFSHCSWKRWTQVPLTRAQKKLLGVATPSPTIETAQHARVRAVEDQPCPVICRGDLPW